jgi:cholesterol transport system auxiliary component
MSTRLLFNWCVASALLCCSALAGAGGCALMTKAETVTPRYFSAEHAKKDAHIAKAPRLQLRLGTVSSASHLDERICYRLNTAELGFYEDRRWTEIPEEYLRRALERELFERRGVQRIITGGGPTLDVELTAFEELRGNPTRARLALSFSLRDDALAIVQDSLEISKQVSGQAGADPAQRVAATLASALGEAAETIASQVIAKLPAPEVDPDVAPSGDAP